MNQINLKSLQSFYDLKSRLMKVFLTFAVLVIIGIWSLEGSKSHVNPIDNIAYPLMIAIFSIGTIVLSLYPKSLKYIESITFYTFAIYCLANFQAMILGMPFFVIDLYSVSTFLQWLPMIYVSAFIMLETRNAIIASVLFYLSLVCSTILYEVMRYVPDFVLNNLYPAIKNICFAQPIYILMVLGIAVLKEQIIEVNTEATDMTIAATTDYLTGISNRRFAAQSLDNFLNLAKIDNLTLTIFVVDIDHFKKINDSYGHDIGDRVLVNIANFLLHNLRDSDLLGRWGGEEFIVILQKTDLQTACNLAERLYKQNSQLIHEQVGQVTFSIGIATSKADDTTDSLFKRADAALYKAKQTGRNHFKVDEQLEQQK